MARKSYEEIEQYVKSLKKHELQGALTPLIDFAIDAEEVSFYGDNKYPYWSNSGEPLVKGQENNWDEDE